MNKATSIYLDLIRFIAAILVFLHHASHERFTGRTFTSLGVFGEDAVMVFFVLSGYVIAYVAAEKEITPREYFVSRFARLYSVAAPALILTVIFDYIGKQTDITIYEGGTNDSYPWVRALISLSFANQIWFLDVRYFSNVPYWSISYEFWYYVIFGVALFLVGYWRWMVLAVLTLVIGPLISLLAPVWLLGVLVYYVNSRYVVPTSVGWFLFIGSAILYFGYRECDISSQLTAMSDGWIAPLINPTDLHKARFFINDYVVGMLVSMHLVGANTLARTTSVHFQKFERPIRFAASYTFSLYLLHYPILHMLSAITPWSAGDIRRTMLLIIGTILIILLIGSVTERRKHLWKHWFLVLWDFALRRPVPYVSSATE